MPHGAAQSSSQTPMTYLELRRREAQQVYLQEQQYVKENKATLDKMLEDDRQAAMASMTGNMWDVFQGMAGLKPIEPPNRPQQTSPMPVPSQHPGLNDNQSGDTGIKSVP